MPNHSPTPSLLFALALIASALPASAQMSPADPRTFAYTGQLEVDGSAANGIFDLRFGLFTSATPDTACLVAEAPSCPLWSTQVDGVRVAGGSFTALLEGVPDGALAQDRLWLAMAVKESSETAFTALGGTQEILPAPWAARAAAAKDYKITGDLTVAGDIETDGAVLADSLYADNVAVVGQAGEARLEATPGAVQSRTGGNAPTTLSLNPGGGDVVLGTSGSTVSTSGNVAVNGEVAVHGSVAVNGPITVEGPASFRCPTGWLRNGAWCIENLRRGGNQDLYTAMATCHNQGGGVCPIEAILTCDFLEQGQCGIDTDQARWLWTSSTYGDDQDALKRIQIYSGIGNNEQNEVDLADATATSYNGSPIYYFCCRAAGGL